MAIDRLHDTERTTFARMEVASRSGDVPGPPEGLGLAGRVTADKDDARRAALATKPSHTSRRSWGLGSTFDGPCQVRRRGEHHDAASIVSSVASLGSAEGAFRLRRSSRVTAIASSPSPVPGHRSR